MSDLDALDQTILHAEEDIRVRIQQLSELKRHRNTRVPVARLPPELLSDVFIRLRDSHIQSLYGEVSSFTDSWIAISHVSQEWRETALATPQLWACIYLRPNGNVQELMRRAHDLPLRLFMSPSEDAAPPSEQLVEAVRGHPGGISAVSLQNLTTNLTVDLIPLLHCSAGHLRILELGYTPLPDNDFFELPSKILKLHFPSLDTLTLVRCSLDRDCALFPRHAQSLRRLSLVRCQPFQIDLNERHHLVRALFNTLQSLQHLEALTLVQCLYIADVRLLSSIPELRLDALRSLYVHERFASCAALSRCLRIPEACRTTMHAVCEGPINNVSRQDIFALLSSHPPRTLYLSLTNTCLRIRSASEEAVFAHSLNLSNAHWSADIQLLAEIARQLSARAVHIYLCIDIPVKLDEFSQLCALCGGAQAVATDFRLEGAPAALALVAECMADPARFLPQLKHVAFKNFDMAAAASADIEQWAQALIKRKKAGMELGVNQAPKTSTLVPRPRCIQ